MFKDLENTGVMVPFADMMNHSQEDHNTRFDYDPNEKAFVLTALRDIEKGEEVVGNYGRDKPSF